MISCGGVISKPQTASRVAIQVRRFLRDKERVNSAVGVTLAALLVCSKHPNVHVMVEHVQGIDRDLLLKSLEEALFYGKESLIQRFLYLYFFNFIWFQIGEDFRASAGTAAE